MFPVVVSDLDGTLLNKEHQISPKTRDVLHRLSEQGVKFVFATGRHYEDVELIRSQLGIDMYLITSNGARVHDMNGNLIIEHNIAPELVTPVLDYRHHFEGVAVGNVYHNSDWYIEQELQELLDFHADSGFTYTVSNFDHIPKNGVQKIFFVARQHEDLLPLSDSLEQRFGSRLSLTYSLPECFEIMAAGVSKATALEEVLKLKGFEFKDAIAFGDGLNDREMLSSVGKGILMGNADKKLIAALPEFEQIDFHYNDAVANHLAELYHI